MRHVQLDGNGHIICLLCNTKLVYKEGADCSCECGNLTVVGTSIMDKEGAHAYSVIPQFYKKHGRRTIIVDIDKTLARTNEYPFLGEINTELAEVLRTLHDKYGMNIVAWSCRTNPRIVGGDQEVRWHAEQIRKFLWKYNLSFIRLAVSPKLYGTLMIDDKCTSYQPLINLFERIKLFGTEKALEDYLDSPNVHTGG